MEGGEEGDEKKEEGAEGEKNEMEGKAALENPHKNEGDDKHAGVAEVPLALLRCMIAHPIVGDIVKQEVVSCEMNHEKFKAGPYAGIAGLLGRKVAED